MWMGKYCIILYRNVIQRQNGSIGYLPGFVFISKSVDIQKSNVVKQLRLIDKTSELSFPISAAKGKDDAI